MTTSQKQTSLFIEEKSTSLREDSHVNLTPQLESEKVKKMTVTSGQKCLEQYKRFNRHGLWARTFSDLLIGMEGWYSTKCKLTWKLKGTKYNRMYFQLYPSTHRTEETGSGLLPTAVASDATTGAIIGKNDKFVMTKTGMPRKINQKGTDGSVGLARLGKLGMLPTPRANQVNGCNLNSEKLANRNKGSLEESVAKWVTGILPTINASDHPGKNTGLRNQDSIPKRLRDSGGKTSQLNPQFVMEMMGFPPDWTLLPFLSGETKASKQEETP